MLEWGYKETDDLRVGVVLLFFFHSRDASSWRMFASGVEVFLAFGRVVRDRWQVRVVINDFAKVVNNSSHLAVDSGSLNFADGVVEGCFASCDEIVSLTVVVFSSTKSMSLLLQSDHT